jgi:hypothetical protein
MKNEIPPSTTSAPAPMATAADPLMPPPEELVEVGVATVGVAVVVSGVPGVTGRPGERGFVGPLPWASADEGASRSAASAAAAAVLRRLGKRLLHGRRLGCFPVRLSVVHMLLVIHALRVDRPDVVTGAVQDVLDRSHGREH